MALWDARTRQWWLQAPAWTAKRLCQIIRWHEKATVSLTSVSLSLCVLCPWPMPSLTRPWLCHSVPCDSVGIIFFNELSDCHYEVWTDGCCLLPWHVSSHSHSHMFFFFFSWCDAMRCNATLSGAQNYAIPDSLEPQSNGACAMIIEKMSIAPMHCGGFLSWIRTTFNECNVLQRKAIRNR